MPQEVEEPQSWNCSTTHGHLRGAVDETARVYTLVQSASPESPMKSLSWILYTFL